MCAAINSFSFKPLLTPDFVTRSLRIKIAILSKPHQPFTQITTDSRKVIPGSLFIALKGENFDGHSFIETAVAQGARGILCKRGLPVSNFYKELCIFPVEDTLQAYRRLASDWRKEFSIPVIAVAGSAGKTTTKELLASILRGKWPEVLKTQGSQNGFIGIPMTLLEMRPEHEAAVIEIGIDEIGAMHQHISVVKPNYSLLTTIGPEHLEHLHDLSTIAREEGIALSSVARSSGTIAINLDDPWIRPHASTLREGRKIPFSLTGSTSPVDMISGKLSDDGCKLNFQGLGIPLTQVPLPLLGSHNASNLLGAIAIAASLGLNAAEIQAGLRYFKGAEGRSELKELPGHIQVICDYYNSQPASVEAGIELLTQLSRRPGEPFKKRWVCLGDMLELGLDEERYHREIANKILEFEIENVLLYGSRMGWLLNELESRNYSGYCAHFHSHTELAQVLINQMKPEDTLLIKGSRGMKMEEVWKTLDLYAKSKSKAPSYSKNPVAHS